jgi:glycine C-acetyltransferase
MTLVMKHQFERRRHNRVAADLEVFFLSSGKQLGKMLDLSQDGISFETYSQLKPGTKILLDFKLPGVSSTIKPYCNLVWVTGRSDPGSRPMKVGAHFVGIYEFDRKKIKLFIESQLNRIDSDNLGMANFIDIYDHDIFKKAEQFWEFIEDTKRKEFNTYEIPLISASKNRAILYDENSHKEREIIMMGSSNYLGLNMHPKVVRAANEVLQKYGTGTGSIRLLSGTHVLHRRVERVLADLKGCEDALIFPTGHMANMGCISALLGKKDIAIVDKRVHASVLDGCLLGTGSFRTFRHSDPIHLRQIFESLAGTYQGKLIVLEGVNGIDGDICPLPEVLEIADEFGAKVMIDEAHATGVIGEGGRGTLSHYKLEGKGSVIMDSLSKALGSLGGYIASTRKVILYLKYYARTSFFSVSPPPAILAASLAAVQVMESEPNLISKLWGNINYMKENLMRIGFNNIERSQSAIMSTVIGDELLLRKINKKIFEQGVYLEPLPFPAVRRGQERLRLRIMATHTREDLDKTLEVLEKVGIDYGVLKKAPLARASEGFSGISSKLTSDGNQVVVSELLTRDEIAESIRFSWTVYKNYPHWVPYFLIQDRVNLLCGDYTYFRRNVITKRFAVKQNGELVGVVSAFLDNRFMSYWNQKVGFLGFFEALPFSDAPIQLLLEEAIEFLKSEGIREVWAPINVPFLLYGGGLLSNGFDKNPSFLQIYNPVYYLDYFNNAAFDPFKTLPHYVIDLTSAEINQFIDSVAHNRGVNIRELNKSGFEDELKAVLRILNDSFPKLWKYVPFDNDEFLELVTNLKDLVLKGLWLVAEAGTEPVGFVGAFPQTDEVFTRASGELEAFDLMLFPKQLENNNEGAIVLLGVLDKYQGRGIGLELLARVCANMIEKGYKKATCTWEISDKFGSHPMMEKAGAKTDESVWTIYRKEI